PTRPRSGCYRGPPARLGTAQLALPVMNGGERFSLVLEVTRQALQFKVGDFGTVHRPYDLSPMRQPLTPCGGGRWLCGCRRPGWRWGSVCRRGGARGAPGRLAVPTAGQDDGDCQRGKHPVPEIG